MSAQASVTNSAHISAAACVTLESDRKAQTHFIAYRSSLIVWDKKFRLKCTLTTYYVYNSTIIATSKTFFKSRIRKFPIFPRRSGMFEIVDVMPTV